MRKVTSITFWNDAIGKRISMTYSDIDENGIVTADNQRVDRIVTDAGHIEHLDAISKMAQEIVDTQ